MTLKNRVQAYCDRKNIAVSYFERCSGLSNGYFKASTKRILDDKISKIRRAFPDLNIDWLQTGEGEMLNPSTAVITGNVTGNGNNFIAGNHNKVGTYAEIVEEIKEEVAEAESIPILSEDLSTATDLDIRAYLDENGDELERINPSQMLQRANLAEKVIKTSMLPTFAPGDIVFVRFMRDKAKLVDGDTYYFDLKSRPTMIRKVKIEGDKLRLIALNPDYGDIVTDRNDIISVAKIIGLLRMTFADFYSNIEEARRRKEEQIENLINKHNTHVESLVSQIDKMGAREDRLISMIENKFNQ